MEYNNADEFFFMVGAEKRAAAKLFRRYRVNRFEINVLASLACYLQVHGKKIVSRKIFADWLGLSYQLEHKIYSYLYGLGKKGLITRLAYRRAKGHSLTISRYGVFILEKFYAEVDAIDQATRDRKKLPGFKSLPIDNNLLPRGYILLDAGRDN